MKLKNSNYILIFLLFVAGFLRFYNLDKQGIFFFDEGHIIYKAKLIWSVLFKDVTDQLNFPSYVDSKPLWVLCVVLAKSVLNGATHAAQYCSGFFGILSVYLTYIFAERFYQSKTIGLLSAAFLSVSSYHIFYCRSALAESTAIFFCMLSLLFYFKSLKGKNEYALISGLFFGMAFLTNRFRVALWPLFILLLEIYACLDRRSWLEGVKKRCGRFLIGISFMIVLWAIFHMGLNFHGINVSAYFASLTGNIFAHDALTPDLFSFLSYPFFIIKFEGFAVGLIIISSIFFIRKQKSPALLLSFIALQIIVSSLLEEKVARSISVILPFIGIVCGVCMYNFILVFNKNRWQKLFVVFICCAVLLSSLLHVCNVLGFRSDIKEATDFIKRKYPEQGILTTNRLPVLVYSHRDDVHPLQRKKYTDLKSYFNSGYGILLLDPERFVNVLGPFWNYLEGELIVSIDKKCQPVKTFDHFSEDLFDFFIYEHNLSLGKTLSFLKDKPKDSGQIKIYELDSCLSSLGQK